MTLAIDSSALIQRYVPGPHQAMMVSAMDADHDWCASELARTEVLLALHRLAGGPTAAKDLGAQLRSDWSAMIVVPIDQACLAAAVDIGSEFGLTTVDAIHLAAADRLPKPLTYATLDSHQIPAAAALGFEIVSPLAR